MVRLVLIVLAFTTLPCVVGGEQAEIVHEHGEEIQVQNGEKSARASLGDDTGDAQSAPRSAVVDAAQLANLAYDDEDGLVVAGFFEPDEDGGVKNREEGSAYQVFRDSSVTRRSGMCSRSASASSSTISPSTSVTTPTTSSAHGRRTTASSRGGRSALSST